MRRIRWCTQSCHQCKSYRAASNRNHVVYLWWICRGSKASSALGQSVLTSIADEDCPSRESKTIHGANVIDEIVRESLICTGRTRVIREQKRGGGVYSVVSDL